MKSYLRDYSWMFVLFYRSFFWSLVSKVDILIFFLSFCEGFVVLRLHIFTIEFPKTMPISGQVLFKDILLIF
jgi:hypothetical protein